MDTSLRWHPRIFVSGPRGARLGPVSRNIAGARRAGEPVSMRLDPFTRPRLTSRQPEGQAPVMLDYDSGMLIATTTDTAPVAPLIITWAG